MEKTMLEIDWFNVLDMALYLLLCGVGTIVACCVTLMFVHGSYGIWLFTGERNPYRRTCRKCGQKQGAFSRTYNQSQWWEDFSPVPDEDCVCHTYSTYHA